MDETHNRWRHLHRAEKQHKTALELKSLFKLTLSASIRERRPKLMQPSRTLTLLMLRDIRENKSAE